MAELRYALREGDEPDTLVAALRRGGADAAVETDVDGVARLRVAAGGDREHVRELIRTARPPKDQRHSVMFEDELAGGA